MSKQYLNQDPKIYIVDDFITPEECNHIISVSKDKLKNALVAGDKKGFVSKGRSGQNCWIGHNTDEIIHNVSKKISKQVEYPLENAESLQVIYYDKDQQYRNHYDAWKQDGSDKSRRCLRRGGQRMITALVYLNDVTEGGETKFTKLDISVKPKQGRLLVFENCYSDTNMVHNLSEHAGTPVIKGEKYAFNLWFRQQDRSKNYEY